MAVIIMDEIRRFFVKMLDELNRRLDSLTIEGNELDISIKENSRFLEVLSKESEVPFSEFTPRDLSYKNEKRINELKEIVDSQNKDKENLDTEIDDIKKRIDEINNLIKILDEKQDSGEDNTSNQAIHSEDDISDISTDNNIKSSLENINSYLPADPMRAKIELKNIINNL